MQTTYETDTTYFIEEDCKEGRTFNTPSGWFRFKPECRIGLNNYWRVRSLRDHSWILMGTVVTRYTKPTALELYNLYMNQEES